jgi:hypothetical protein
LISLDYLQLHFILQTLYTITSIEWDQSPSKYLRNEACQIDINTHLSDQETKPFNVGLRQVQVERRNTTRLKGRRSCGKCNDEVKLGCWCVLWEGEGEGEGIEAMSETIPQQEGSAPHQKQQQLTSALAIGMVVQLRHTVLACKSRWGGQLGSLNRTEL